MSITLRPDRLAVVIDRAKTLHERDLLRQDVLDLVNSYEQQFSDLVDCWLLLIELSNQDGPLAERAGVLLNRQHVPRRTAGWAAAPEGGAE